MSETRSVALLGVGVVAVVALLLAGGALISSAGTGSASAAGASSPDAPAADGERLPVSLTEMAISPAPIEAASADVLEVANDGSAEHDLTVEGASLATPGLEPGVTEELALSDLAPGEHVVFCSLPGHRAAGMETTLTISDSGGGDGAEPAADDGAEDDAETEGGHGGDDADWAAMDADMTESMLAFPAETEGSGNQPLEPEEVLDDGTKVFRLVAERFDWEVAPGEVVEGWGYNGQIPGPEIRVDVGDRVQVIVDNELPLGTDVHWHGMRVPNSQDGVAPFTQDLIEPGESFTYEFVADEPAIGMYHPHHHGQMKLPNGMFGAFIVGDSPVPYGETIGGREIPSAEEIGELTEVPMILNDAGTVGLSLNGKSFPATEPITVGEDEWFVIHYYNEGLTSHPMHLHQFPQLVFAKDGEPMDAPRWEDTVNVAPGERYSVLVHADDPGTWVFHCHILTHVERETGMFGMVSALVVE